MKSQFRPTSAREARLVVRSALRPGYLFVLPWEPSRIGGVNEVVSNLYHQVEQHGQFRPAVFVSSWNANRPEASVVCGMTTIRFRLRPPVDARHLVYSMLAYTGTLPATIIFLHHLMHENRIRVINIHYPGLTVAPFQILKSLGLFRGKLIISLHGSDLRKAKQSQGIERVVWRTLLRKADTIVACSRWLEEEVRQFMPELSNLTCIYNGIDQGCMERGREVGFSIEKSLTSKRLIVSVAKFEHQKGQDVLLEAFCKVRSLHADVHLVLIGAATEHLRHFQAQAHRCGIQEHVSFIPDLPHGRVGAYLERACLFVLASRHESFGIVILEAGLCRCAVLASAVGGIPEILEHELTGLLVPPGDVARLAREIDRLLRDPELRSSLGERLYQRVLHNFSWQSAYEKYIAAILDKGDRSS